MYNNINYRCRSCDTNLTSSNTSAQYQRLKIIQNTVRVPSSLYTMNLGSLQGQHQQTTCWNQMSDRAVPSIQTIETASGSTYGSNSLKGSKVRNRPGSMSPGGIGCDIKHNSYERRLNRLKGKSLLKREKVPADYSTNSKNLKTNIVQGCNDCNDTQGDSIIYAHQTNHLGLSSNYFVVFYIGETVYTQKEPNTPYLEATITGINNNSNNKTYQVTFAEDEKIYTKYGYELYTYMPCYISPCQQQAPEESYAVFNGLNPETLLPNYCYYNKQ